MKIALVPPYKPVGSKYQMTNEGPLAINEVIELVTKRGQMEGVELDIADAYPIENPLEERDEIFLAEITPGFLRKIKEYSEMGKYDAIITNGSIEPGFFAAREISKIPIASGPHSAMYMASLIADRFSVLELTDAMAQIVRHYAQTWGISHKLVSIRNIGVSSIYMMRLLHKYKNKEERLRALEVKEVIDSSIIQCTAAIEKDRANAIILGCIPLQTYWDVFRQRLDQKGYQEIPLIMGVSAALEMAKAMVNLKLMPSKRAYPSDNLKRQPAFR
jgi:Asp/Glu/hydantoin racemase